MTSPKAADPITLRALNDLLWWRFIRSIFFVWIIIVPTFNALGSYASYDFFKMADDVTQTRYQIAFNAAIVFALLLLLVLSISPIITMATREISTADLARLTDEGKNQLLGYVESKRTVGFFANTNGLQRPITAEDVMRAVRDLERKKSLQRYWDLARKQKHALRKSPIQSTEQE